MGGTIPVPYEWSIRAKATDSEGKIQEVTATVVGSTFSEAMDDEPPEKVESLLDDDKIVKVEFAVERIS